MSHNTHEGIRNLSHVSSISLNKGGVRFFFLLNAEYNFFLV